MSASSPDRRLAALAPAPLPACAVRPRRAALARWAVAALATAWLWPAGPAAWAASIYACRDEHGRAFTSDRPIAECSRTTQRELRRDGSLIREIAPPLTPEQIRQRELEAERRRLEELARRDQQQRDRALLMSYPDEAKFELARQRAIEPLAREIADAQQRIVDLDRRMKALQQQLDAALRGAGGDSARETAREVQALATQILAEDAIVQARRADLARTESRFDEERQRLRQLLPARAAEPPLSRR